MCTGWATHFEKLAEPLQCEQFDQQHLELVHKDILKIETISRKRQSTPIDPISEKELHNALSRLKNNKAAVVLKLTRRGVLNGYLLKLLNFMIKEMHVSPVLKEGFLTPIFKKGDKSNPSNYRGITVTPVILKILEHVLNERQNTILLESQSKLQKGFTAGSSSMSQP